MSLETASYKADHLLQVNSNNNKINANSNTNTNRRRRHCRSLLPPLHLEVVTPTTEATLVVVTITTTTTTTASITTALVIVVTTTTSEAQGSEEWDQVHSAVVAAALCRSNKVHFRLRRLLRLLQATTIATAAFKRQNEGDGKNSDNILIVLYGA